MNPLPLFSKALKQEHHTQYDISRAYLVAKDKSIRDVTSLYAILKSKPTSPATHYLLVHEDLTITPRQINILGSYSIEVSAVIDATTHYDQATTGSLGDVIFMPGMSIGSILPQSQLAAMSPSQSTESENPAYAKNLAAFEQFFVTSSWLPRSHYDYAKHIFLAGCNS